MPRLEPPGWPWLLACELRLMWRAFGLRSWPMAALGVLLIAFAHLAGFAFWRSGLLTRGVQAASAAYAAVTVFVVLLVLSAAFGLAVRALFERGDLDLLGSSPVPVTHVFATRGIAVAAGAVAPVALFVLPVADMGPLAGHWGALAAWPALFAIGLACAAAGFAGTLALVRWIGARRARVAAQVAGAFIGAALVLAMQLQSMLPRSAQRAVARWMEGEEGRAALGPDSILLWPLRAMLGEIVPLLAIVALAVGAFAWVVRGTARQFSEAVMAPEAIATGRRRDRGAGEFREGLARIVVRKELLLMARDPMLIGKSLLQVLYLIPLFVVMARHGQGPEALAAGLVLLSASIAATLGWIAVSGEEAPDLLGSAPVGMARLRALKVVGATIPIAVLVLPFIAWYAVNAAAVAPTVALFVAAAVLSSAMVQVWGTRLGAGRDLAVRRSQGWLLRLADNVSSFGWAGACYAAMSGAPWFLVALALAVGLFGPVGAWLSSRLRD